MVVSVENEKEAVDLSRRLTVMSNDIRLAFITDDIKVQSYESLLCRIRDSIVVQETGDMR